MEKIKLEAFNTSEIEDVKILIRVKGKHYSIAPKDGMMNVARDARVKAITELFNTHNVVGVPLEQLNPKKVLKNLQEQKRSRMGVYDPKAMLGVHQMLELKKQYTSIMGDLAADDWKERIQKWHLEVLTFLSDPHNRKFKEELEEHSGRKFLTLEDPIE